MEWSNRAGFTDGVSPPLEQEDGGYALVIGEADWTRCPSGVAAFFDNLTAGQKLYFDKRGRIAPWTCFHCQKELSSARTWTFKEAPLLVVECTTCKKFCWCLLPEEEEEVDDGR